MTTASVGVLVGMLQLCNTAVFLGFQQKHVPSASSFSSLIGAAGVHGACNYVFVSTGNTILLVAFLCANALPDL